MKILDLFAGSKSVSSVFEKQGHEVFTIDILEELNPDLCIDILQLTPAMIIEKFGMPDVIWASPPCFTAGTLILTDTGYKKIENIKINDNVLTHTNTFQRVKNTMQRQTNEIYKIKPSCSNYIETTSEHPFYVKRKGKSYKTINGKRTNRRVFSNPQWIEAKDLTKNDFVGIAINPNECLPKWEGATTTFRNQFGTETEVLKDDLKQYFNDENFWWIVGRYIGDGWLRIKNEDIGIKSRYETYICCKKDELKEITSALDKLGDYFKYNIQEQEATYRICLCKKEMTLFLSQFGKYAHGKRLNNTIFDLPVNLLESFIQGYISADGHLNESRNLCKITTVSEELAYGIGECIAKAYKKPYSIEYLEVNPKGIIQGRIINQRNKYIISFKTNNSKTHGFYENNHIWIPIRDIQIENKLVTVYNMSVDNDESYTVNNIIVHNCECFSIASCSHHWNVEKDEKGKVTKRIPKSEGAKISQELVKHTLELIKALNPKYYFIENPRGMLRKMPFMEELPRYTVTYCQYGDSRMKPTDIWSNHPNPNFKPMCKNGDPCHEAAPRGSRTGTQGRKTYLERSHIPEKLIEHIITIANE